MTLARARLDVAPHASRRDVAVVVASVALHVLAAGAMGRVGADAAARRAPGPTEVRLEIAPPKPAETPPAPPEPPPAPRERRVLTRAARPAPAPLAAAPRSAPSESPPADEPVDLTGVTLTDPNGGAWTAAAGNGASRSGPVGPVGPPRTAAPAVGPDRDGDTGFVPLADLRQAPQPPELQGALERQYPAEARREGTNGQAQLRARVRPDGNLDRIRVLVASAPMFGDACRRVLAGSRWTPPLDREGMPCATEIKYVCRFEVAH